MANRKNLSKAARKLHTVTKIVIVLSLAVGIGIGFGVCSLLSAGDDFRLEGDTAITLDVGAAGSTYFYAEEGVTAICFGRDVSDTLQVETELERDAEGHYVIPTDRAGVYTITYTVDCLKFGDKMPGGAIKRIRVFTVTAAEEGNGNG